MEITREMFAQAISSLIARTDILLEVALEEASVKPSGIDKVLLVGGSSRIPLVQQRLKKMFGSNPETTVNVDECVSLGAALYAGLTLLREKPDVISAGIAGGLKDINLTDVCNHSYGTICAPLDKETGQRVIRNRLILKKNTPLPCQKTEMFYTLTEGQTEIEVAITQGEDTDIDYVNKVGTYKFELPEGRPAKCPIKVTYSYDINQRMHCKFLDLKSARVLELDFCTGQNGQMVQNDTKHKYEQLAVFSVK